MRRQFARWSFLLLILSLISADVFAESSVAQCLEARLYWQSLAEKLDPHADLSILDQAAKALIKRGRSFSVRSFRGQGRETGDMVSAAATFRGVASLRDEFIPKFQERLKQLSNGKAELISITPAEAGVQNPKLNSAYFRMIRPTSDGPKESYLVLTQEGFNEVPSVGAKAKKPREKDAFSDAFDEPAQPYRRGGTRKEKVETLSLEGLRVTPEDSKKVWSLVLNATKAGEAAASDASQYDRAAFSLSRGKSYDVVALKEARFRGDSVQAAFTRAENSWDLFVPQFQDRVYQLSSGKAQISPISAKEAGFDIVGVGRFFKLVWHEGRLKQESVVWLTSEGVSVYPVAKN